MHLTNVTAAGAAHLASSLLPAMESLSDYAIDTLYLPDRGPLRGYKPQNVATQAVNYTRRVPNSVSRIAESTFLASRFDGATPLLVLGDLPLRTSARQVVFVQTSLLTGPISLRTLTSPKYALAKTVFSLNRSRVAEFVVQTPVMKRALVSSYRIAPGNVHVIPQPPPEWLLDANFRASPRARGPGDGLRLFYPAASYPHKNHALLAQIEKSGEKSWPLSELRITLPVEKNPSKQVSWIRCIGMLDPARMLAEYAYTDALLFLSRRESYGFPLLEAMTVGLPIVCADRDYSRDLCGDDAIYFDAGSADSLRTAVEELRSRLDSGWWPDWSARLARIPKSWAEVAEAFLRLTTSTGR